MLNSDKVKQLKNLIRDSFRIRPNHDPLYIDVSNHLERLKAKQHQIIYGRRGSGKSCLLVHYKNTEAVKQKALPIYIDTDEVKRLKYPDVLIRLILKIMESTPSANKGLFKNLFTKKSKVQKSIKDLRKLLSQAENQKVVREDKDSTSISGGVAQSGVTGSGTKTYSSGIRSEFEEQKLDSLERFLVDYKDSLITELTNSKFKFSSILIDDFYLIRKGSQPDVIDYLHRLCRGTDFYLKIGTVRHRTKLIRNEDQTIGIDGRQDMEEINLDRTLDNLSSPSEYLARILNKMGESVGLESCSTQLFNHNAFEKLVIASGGVPRDFLTIFVDAIDMAGGSGKERHLTPTDIWKAGSSLSYRTKLTNLRSDVSTDSDSLERLFRDLMRFCISEKKKTCFLISQDESQSYSTIHEYILQLMDFKLIHVVEPDTSAASGRQGRFEAYTLDFSLFMEPRKRNISIIEFWNFDEGGRRIGVREAPVYSLKRASDSIHSDDRKNTEEYIEEVEST